MALKIQESAENYLETILILQNRLGAVRSIDIVNELEFAKPSVSIAMKNLRENGYIAVSAEGYITLTDRGRDIAETIYERHTLLTDWLIRLGVDKQVAAQDACRIEHVISAESFEAIKRHTRPGREQALLVIICLFCITCPNRKMVLRAGFKNIPGFQYG